MGEDSIQRLFECSHRNQEVYEKIARDMEAAGYTRSQKQISSKLKKLKYQYRRIKDDHNQTGRGRTCWKFFEPMDAILGHKPSTQPPVVAESATAAAADKLDDNEDEQQLAHDEYLRSDSPESSFSVNESTSTNLIATSASSSDSVPVTSAKKARK